MEEEKSPPPSEIGGADEFVNLYGKDVKFRFKRLSEYQPGEAWMLLLYGNSKTGKTFFAGTAGPRTLFINIGEGIETLMAPAFTSRYPNNNMIMVDVRERNPQGVAEAFDVVSDVIDFALSKFPEKFDTVVLDEASAFRKFALNKSMELNTNARTTSSRKNRIDEYVKADVGDYGEEMNMVEWFLGTYIPTFKAAGKNFLMLAHERQVFGKPSKIGDDPVLKRVLPGFTGKTFPDKVPSFFDDVWRIEVVGSAENSVYRIRTAGDEMYVGGARHGGIFNNLEPDPNYLKMLERIKLAQPKPKKR